VLDDIHNFFLAKLSRTAASFSGVSNSKTINIGEATNGEGTCMSDK